jgi:hypothetical protein
MSDDPPSTSGSRPPEEGDQGSGSAAGSGPWPAPTEGHQGSGHQPPGYQPPPPTTYPTTGGYGQPSYGYGRSGAPQTEGTATVALIVAIVGFFVCPPVGAIVALILANNAQQRIDASGGALTGSDQVKAAQIIAWIELGLTLLIGLVLFMSFMGMLGAMFSRP